MLRAECGHLACAEEIENLAAIGIAGVDDATDRGAVRRGVLRRGELADAQHERERALGVEAARSLACGSILVVAVAAVRVQIAERFDRCRVAGYRRRGQRRGDGELREVFARE